MDRQTFGSKLGDALLTILATWATLILAGLAGLRLQPSMAGVLVSLAVYLTLLFAWSRWTGPGRRAPLIIPLLGAFLYWLGCVALFIAFTAEMMTGPLQWVGAGMVIGFQPAPNPHTPVETFLIPLVLNLFGPILAVGWLQVLLRRDRAG